MGWGLEMERKWGAGRPGQVLEDVTVTGLEASWKVTGKGVYALERRAHCQAGATWHP